MHALPRESFEFPPKKSLNIDSRSSSGTDSLTSVPVGRGIQLRISRLYMSFKDGRALHTTSSVSDARRGYSSNRAIPPLSGMGEQHHSSISIPTILEASIQEAAGKTQASEAPQVWLDGLDLSDLGFQLDGKGSSDTPPTVNIPRRSTSLRSLRRSSIDAGDNDASDSLLPRTDTMQSKLVEGDSVNDTLLTHATPDAAAPTRMRDFFKIPKLEIRDRTPFHPPGHTTADPRYPYATRKEGTASKGSSDDEEEEENNREEEDQAENKAVVEEVVEVTEVVGGEKTDNGRRTGVSILTSLVPKLEIRDRTPFHPPGHSLAEPRIPRATKEAPADDRDADSSRRKSSATIGNLTRTGTSESTSTRRHSLSPSLLKRNPTLLEDNVEDTSFGEAHPNAVAPLRRKSTAAQHEIRPAPHIHHHVPGSYRTELSTPIPEDDTPHRQETPKDLIGLSKLRLAASVRSGSPAPSVLKSKRPSISTQSVSSYRSDRSVKSGQQSSYSLLTRGSVTSTMRHSLLKPTISSLSSIDKGLPISTILSSTSAIATPIRRASGASLAASTLTRHHKTSTDTVEIAPAATIVPSPLSAAGSVSSLRQLYSPASVVKSVSPSQQSVKSLPRTSHSSSVTTKSQLVSRRASKYEAAASTSGTSSDSSDRSDTDDSEARRGAFELASSLPQTSTPFAGHSANAVSVTAVSAKPDVIKVETPIEAATPVKEAATPRGKTVTESIFEAAKRAERYLLHGGSAQVSEAEALISTEAEKPPTKPSSPQSSAGSENRRDSVPDTMTRSFTSPKRKFTDPVVLDLGGTKAASIKSGYVSSAASKSSTTIPEKSSYSGTVVASRRNSKADSQAGPLGVHFDAALARSSRLASRGLAGTPPAVSRRESQAALETVSGSTSADSSRRSSYGVINIQRETPLAQAWSSRHGSQFNFDIKSSTADPESRKHSQGTLHIPLQVKGLDAKSAASSAYRRPSTSTNASGITRQANADSSSYQQLAQYYASNEKLDGVSLDESDPQESPIGAMNESKGSSSWETVNTGSAHHYDSVPSRRSSTGPSHRQTPKSGLMVLEPVPTNATMTPAKRTSVDEVVAKLRSSASSASIAVETTSSKVTVMPVYSSKPNEDTGTLLERAPSKVVATKVEKEVKGEAHKHKHRRTVHWLRDLLSSHNSSTTTQLTAIPPRKHRSARQSHDSQDIEAIEGIEASDIEAIRSTLMKTHEENSTAFSKTIEDLESLLNEALLIARQAAEKDESTAESVAGRRGSTSRTFTHTDNAQGRSYGLPGNRPRLRSVASKQSTDLRSIHESGGSSSSSEDEVSHPSDLYPQQYHTAVRVTSGLSDGMNIHQAAHQRGSGSEISIADPGHDKWASVPTAADKIRKMSIMPRPASKTDFKQRIKDLTPPNRVGAIINYSSRVRINSRGEARQVPENLVSYPKPLARLTNLDRPSSPLSYSHSHGGTTGTNLRSPPDEPTFDSIMGKVSPEIPGRSQSERKSTEPLPTKRDVSEYIKAHHEPPIMPRKSSLKMRKTYTHRENEPDVAVLRAGSFLTRKRSRSPSTPSDHHSLDGPQEDSDSEVEFIKSRKSKNAAAEREARRINGQPEEIEMGFINQTSEAVPTRHLSGRKLNWRPQSLHLRGRSHVSLDKRQGFSLARSHKRQPIARDWSTARKRLSATVACLSTALIGVLVGIYAGMVPSIQYYIVDFNHYAILGNVVFYIGLAIPTIIFWPLPLLHGRKPYILSSMALAMPLLFPQAISVGTVRSPYVATFRVGLLLSRAFMGVALGFANMNFFSILTDLFGASLQSSKPHQEFVNPNDVRRHGGGVGIWLGIITWCSIGSIGVGFLAGSAIINTLSPDWGFYICIIIIAGVLLLNVLTPEVRRSAYRRSVTEVRTSTDVSRRLARGEVMMHRLQTGPKWWGEEVYHGLLLSGEMLRQPGFLVMALYTGWTYAQIVLVIVLLGSLTSKYYLFPSPSVGGATMALPIGAVLAVPFQKASLLSRSRKGPQRTDSMTFEKRVTWSSHLIRRLIFTLTLPFAGLAYTLSSGGPPTPWILPILFSALIGFLSSLAIAECTGIIMETFDTSDLQPGMTGRPRGPSGERTSHKRTNYSSFPRVTSGINVSQAIGYLFAAAATGVGGRVERQIGAQAATGVMAGILLFLTILLLGALIRFKEVQIIPDSKKDDMHKYEEARRRSTMVMANMASNPDFTERDFAQRQQLAEEEEEVWRPVIIGNPSGTTRRVSLLELGGLSRWSEIRKKNRLIDQDALEGRHPNLAAMGSVKGRLKEKGQDVKQDLKSKGGSLKEASRSRLGRSGSGRNANTATATGSGRSAGAGPSGQRRGVTLTDGEVFEESEATMAGAIDGLGR